MQLLKLAVSQAIPDLSGVYVIWDMDMIPTRHIPLVYLPGPDISSQGAGHSWQLPVDVNVMSVHGQPARTVVNIGGAWSPGYGESYEKLFQKRCGTSSCAVPVVPVQREIEQREIEHSGLFAGSHLDIFKRLWEAMLCTQYCSTRRRALPACLACICLPVYSCLRDNT